LAWLFSDFDRLSRLAATLPPIGKLEVADIHKVWFVEAVRLLSSLAELQLPIKR
jgi:hypothetical protein